MPPSEPQTAKPRRRKKSLVPGMIAHTKRRRSSGISSGGQISIPSADRARRKAGKGKPPGRRKGNGNGRPNPRGKNGKASADVPQVGDMDLLKYCRGHTKAAIDTILSLMRKADRDNVRLRAAMVILERGYGLPIQLVTNASAEEAAMLIQRSVEAAEAGLRKENRTGLVPIDVEPT